MLPMIYAHITNGVIDRVSELPGRWWDGMYWHDYRDEPEKSKEHGWLPVVETPRPVDTDTDTYDASSPQLVDGVPTQVWTARPWTVDELAVRSGEKIRLSLDEKVRAAVSKDGTLKAVIGTTDDVAWDGNTANPTLRSLNKMSAAQINAVGTHKVMAKFLSIMVDMAMLEQRIGKLTIDMFDEA